MQPYLPVPMSHDRSATPSGIECILVTKAELERLRAIEQCARYLINSNAWVGDTDGIEANLTALQELLGIKPID